MQRHIALESGQILHLVDFRIQKYGNGGGGPFEDVKILLRHILNVMTAGNTNARGSYAQQRASTSLNV